MKTFALGDIHGNYKALKQCLERSNFDYDNDRLVFLGDICDGYRYVDKCIDELLKIKKCYCVIGNHDYWTLEWIESNGTWKQPIWVDQGGRNTLLSYADYPNMFPPHSHCEFLCNMYPFITLGTNDDIIFVHGGFDPNQKDLTKQNPDELMWNRDLMQSAIKKHNQNPNYKYADKKEIYIGHTSTQFFQKDGKCEPLIRCNVICLDTGAGWNGKLTIMDIESKQYWQSDLATDLYPGECGR